MKKMNIIIIFFILLNAFFTKIIKIPFGIINREEDSEISPLITNLVYNKIYINLTIGSPPQKIKIMLHKDNYALFISKNNFNKNLSDSLESDTETTTFYLDLLYTGYYSKDIMSFGNYINNTTKLNFVISEIEDNSLGHLGLKIPAEFPDRLTSFIETLYHHEIISSYTWTLKYYYSNKKLLESINDKINPIGELIIGGEPHEYEENKKIYPENEYHFLEAPTHNNKKYYWDLKIKNIYTISEGEKIEIISNSYYKDEVSLKAENSFIIGTDVYKKLIYNCFFKKYDYNNTICREDKIPQKNYVNYIECNNDELFDLKKFPSIYFESFEFNKTFELTYEDLFVLDEKSNKYIFLILFPTNYVETTWNLGIPFLRKYQFTYNENKKVIGFYNIDKKDKDKDNNNKIWLYIIFGLLFMLFCGLLIFLGMFMHKCLYGEKRRKKANELDDGYDYEVKEGINSDINIREENNKKKRLVEEE